MSVSQATLACIHLLCVWIGLPDLFPIHHALWLTLVIIPLISLSMLFAYVDPEGKVFQCKCYDVSMTDCLKLADMTPMRTPPKRVVYPDTFIAPDRAQCPWKETVKTPPLTSNSTSTTDPDGVYLHRLASIIEP